ncbi:MAG TPA: SRPBCC domain-containing protein [Ktedonobacteraceae bacterium]|jgi:carbon monoxide dehydrogenase subunit G|nr:SRPBCC domain-containing protein [Ktedonobacteraceae bacterium]
MKLNGTHKFKVSSSQVYNAILNPATLQASIPGCDGVTYLDDSRIQADITTPIPGLKGPYAVVINIANRQAPSHLELQVQRQGRGGKVNAVSQIDLTDEADGALLSYNASAELEGPVAIANNPLSQGIVKKSLSSFFENLEKSL